jgi:hypothetical protein
MTDVVDSGNAFEDCEFCSVSDSLDLTCICPQHLGSPKRETTINLEASVDQASGLAGTGVYLFSEKTLSCHVV